MLAMTPDWAGNAQTAQAVVHATEHLLRNQLSGFVPIHVHCWTKLYRPVNTGQSGFQTAMRLICRVKQYVTAP